MGKCPASGRAPFSSLLCVRSGSEEGGTAPDVGTGGIRGERMWVLCKLAAVGCWGRERAFSGRKSVCRLLGGVGYRSEHGLWGLPPETSSEGRATTACWGGTGYLTVHRQVAADGPSAGGWGRWCGLADGRPNGGHPDSVCGRVAAGAGEQRHAGGGSGMGVDGVPRPVSPRVQRRSGPGNLGLFPPNGVLRHVDPLRWTQPSPTAMGRPTNTATNRSKRTPPPTLRPL